MFTLLFLIYVISLSCKIHTLQIWIVLLSLNLCLWINLMHKYNRLNWFVDLYKHLFSSFNHQPMPALENAWNSLFPKLWKQNISDTQWHYKGNICNCFGDEWADDINKNMKINVVGKYLNKMPMANSISSLAMYVDHIL